jgi:pyruvate kinase
MMQRPCNAKIVATLGPASADRSTIEALVRAGADVFRLNFSHGTHADHKQRLELIRSIEADIGRPIGVLLDLQGPKLRVGSFANGPVKLVEGAPFRLDLDRGKPGDATGGFASRCRPRARTSPRPGSSTAACCLTARA